MSSTEAWLVPLADWHLDVAGGLDPELEKLIEGIEEESLDPKELFSAAQLESLKPFLDRLPPLEADFIELYYGLKKHQSEIALMFGMTQANVSYRLSRAVSRIQYMLRIPPYTEQYLRDKLSPHYRVEIVDTMVAMWFTTSLIESADCLELSTNTVRGRFVATMESLRLRTVYNPAEWEELHQAFLLVWNNLNILREVSNPFRKARIASKVAATGVTVYDAVETAPRYSVESVGVRIHTPVGDISARRKQEFVEGLKDPTLKVGAEELRTKKKRAPRVSLPESVRQEIRDKHASGYSQAQLCREYGLRSSTIGVILRNDKPLTYKPISPETGAKIIELRAQGVAWYNIGPLVGHSPGGVRKWWLTHRCLAYVGKQGNSTRT